MKIDLSNIHGKIVKPQEGFQESFAASTVDVVWGGGILAAGKLQSLDSKVLTQSGFVEMRDIKVGSKVVTPFDGIANVTAIFPQGVQDVYELKTIDGRRCECGLDHLWTVRTPKQIHKHRKDPKKWDWYKTLTTKDIIKGMEEGRKFFLPVNNAIEFDEKELPIPPYVLGVLIGDGLLTNLRGRRAFKISNTEEDIIQKIAKLTDTTRIYHQSSCYTKYFYTPHYKEYKDYLTAVGLATYSYHKFIPQEYLHSSIKQRRELLAGLIDTDGSIDPGKNCFRFSTTSERLKDDFLWLCRSLGYSCRVSVDKRSDKYTLGVSYEIRIRTDDIIFTSNKHWSRYNKERNATRFYGRTNDHTRIISIKKVRRTECQCILVDDEKHLYITDDFIVTHNSFALVLAMAEPLMTDPDFRGLISRKALQSLKAGGGFVEKFRQIFGDYCSVKESDNPRISFPNGSFCDLTYIDDSDMGRLRERAKGWEYDVIGVDEMTEMSFECFSYIMTRNRGNSKTFTGKMFATLNPKRSHWSRKFLDWYIGYDGYIIPERNGMIRYFYIRGNTVDDVVWGNTKEEVYLNCRIDIDRKLAAVGGNYSYENMIKSFVFYQGKLSENSAMLENNPDYIGSVAASGGRMSMALLEGNFNSDPDDEDNKVISNNAARSVFEEDAKRNGVRWVTVDLADYGTDNLVALAWDGLHVIDKMVLMHTTPRENAENIKIFAQNNNVGESHIIYDGVNGRYINDYIPDAVCYMSSRGAFGMYGNQSGTIKDMCYLRLCNIINSNNMSMSQSIGESTYVHSKLKKHVTIQEEFINECAAVEFRTLPNGKKKLLPKRTMNRNLSGKRSMDLLDPIAMRMLPLANYPYGEELEMEAREFVAYDDTTEYVNTDNSETVNIYDERTWA